MNVPKLRFKEFDGEWEADFLEKAIDVKSGKDYKHLDKGNVPVYGTGGYMLSVNDYLSDKDAIGIGRKGSIDKPQKLIAPFWTVDTLFYCLPKEHNNLSFLFTLFQKVPWKKFDESTGVPSLSKTTIEKIKINLPNKDEQKKIGVFFELINKKIQLQQQKIDLLQEQKKGYMQKIFNRELRFRDASQNQYTDWKLETVKDVFEFHNGKAHEKNIVLNGEYIVVNSKFISTEGSVKKYSNNQIFPLVKDDIAMVMSDVPNGKALAKCHIIKENNKFSLNQRICCLRTPMNSNFFYYQLNRNNFYLKFDDGVNQTNLRKEDVLKCPLYVPCLEEQNKIANFLMMLDKRIELEKEKLFNLKHRKDGFMQQMFI